MVELSSRVIEYTSVKQGATVGGIKSLCNQAMLHKYRGVCVNSGYVDESFKLLRHNDEMVLVSTAGFPTGGGSVKAKVYEAIVAGEQGAKEIDYVINLGFLKDRRNKELTNEVRSIVRNTKGLCDVKIIIEAPVLTEEEIVRVSNLCVEEGAAFIKTATGFNGETTPEMVKLIRKHVGDKIKIKAAGGIRDLETVEAMLRAGADTIGTSTLIKFEDED